MNIADNREIIQKDSYADSIGECGDFRPNGADKQYQIPFGALYNENFDNLLAAGKIVSDVCIQAIPL